jgi:hypothetical protein
MTHGGPPGGSAWEAPSGQPGKAGKGGGAGQPPSCTLRMAVSRPGTAQSCCLCAACRYSLTARGRARLARKLAQSNAVALAAMRSQAAGRGSNGGGRGPEVGEGVSAAVFRQLELLGPDHVGYGAAHYPHLDNLTIVGERAQQAEGIFMRGWAGRRAAQEGNSGMPGDGDPCLGSLCWCGLP